MAGMATPAKIETGTSFGKVDGKNPHAAHSARQHGVAATHERLAKLQSASASLTPAQIAAKNSSMNPYSAPKKAPKSRQANAATSAGISQNMQQQVRSLESSTQGL